MITNFRLGITYCIVQAIFFAACDSATVTYPVRKEIIETVYASGIIVPKDEHWLSCEANGRIVKKFVGEGDTVTKGQILYAIADDVAQRQYAAAKSDYNSIRYNLSKESPVLNELVLVLNTTTLKFQTDSLNYIRWKNLWEQNIGTKSNLEKMHMLCLASKNEMLAAREKYASAKNELRNSAANAGGRLSAAGREVANMYIRSDCDGVVYKITKENGEFVSAGEKVVLVGDAHESLIRLQVDQQDIRKVKRGQTALIRLDAIAGTIYEANITFIAPSMNEKEQTFRIEACAGQMPPHRFLHSAVEANIIVDRKKEALIIPRIALDGNDSCWIKDKGRKRKIELTTGLTTFNEVEVLSGLTEKTAVVIRNANVR